MTTLAKVEYEREEFCRFDDYGRYAKHLSRKLHTLRRAADKSQEILLFSAERVWSNAMQNKSVNGKNQITLNKLRKACRHAGLLVDSYASTSPKERLQASVYHDYLAASLNQERGAFDEAIVHYSRALVALQNQSSSLMESVETGLRFCIYQSGTEERSINLQKFALAHLESNVSNGDWRALVEFVDPAALQQEKGEEMITSIQWANRSAPLRHAELTASISAAVSARSTLKTPASPNDFDIILAAWSTASITLNSLLEKEEDQDLSQDLELTKAWVTYHASIDRIARDKALISTVSTREGILLCDSINQTYIQILALAGLDETQQTELNKNREEIRGERCVLLAATHETTLEAIALLNRALTYYAASSPRRQEVVASLNKTNAHYSLSTNKQTRFDSKRWFAGDVKQLGRLDPRDLLTKSVSMKPVVFDIAWNYIVAGQETTSRTPLKQAAKVVSSTLDKMDVEASEKTPSAKTSTPKKGLFGGLFGSGR